MRSSKSFFRLLFGLILGATTLLTSSISHAQTDPVKLGAILCLTGDLAMDCGAFREGIELAVHEYNSRADSANKRKLEVEFQDSGRVPKTAQTIARKFGSDDKILGVIISTLFEAKNSSPAFEKFGIPSLVLWDSTPELEAMGEYTFAIGPWAPSTYEESAKFALKNLNAKKVVVVATIEEWAQYVSKGFEKTFTAAGGEVLGHIDVNADNEDFRSIIARIAKLDPDVIYAPMNPHLEIFVRQCKEQSLRAKIVTSDNITTALLRANPDVLNGVYQSMVSDPQGAETTALAKKYREYFGHDPDLILFVAWAYDAVNLFIKAIEVGGADRRKIRDAMATISGFNGASGKITMNPEGSSRMMATIFEVVDDRLVPATK